MSIYSVAVDISSFCFPEQKDLYSSDMVQGFCLFSRKYRWYILMLAFLFRYVARNHKCLNTVFPIALSSGSVIMKAAYILALCGKHSSCSINITNVCHWNLLFFFFGFVLVFIQYQFHQCHMLFNCDKFIKSPRVSHLPISNKIWCRCDIISLYYYTESSAVSILLSVTPPRASYLLMIPGLCDLLIWLILDLGPLVHFLKHLTGNCTQNTLP